MTEKEKKRRADVRFEIRARKLALKRLTTPLKQAKAAAEKKKAKRQERISAACAYESYEDAQTAYGFGMITEEEFDEIAEAMELGQEWVEHAITPEEAAVSVLQDIVQRLEREISDFEWDLLSEEEKKKIRQQNEEILARRKNRKAASDE